MGVKLVSASGGSVEINPPATASNFIATMPAGTGTVAVNGVSGTLVSGTAVASTSGTSIDFTGIPSWVRRITVMLNGVSTNGASQVQVQLGSGSVQTTGYSTSGAQVSNGAATVANLLNTGFGFAGGNNGASSVRTGVFIFTLVSGSVWMGSVNGAFVDGAATVNGGGAVTLSGTLDRVRITTVNGTDTFDAGSINIMYE